MVSSEQIDISLDGVYDTLVHYELTIKEKQEEVAYIKDEIEARLEAFVRSTPDKVIRFATKKKQHGKGYFYPEALGKEEEIREFSVSATVDDLCNLEMFESSIVVDYLTGIMLEDAVLKNDYDITKHTLLIKADRTIEKLYEMTLCLPTFTHEGEEILPLAADFFDEVHDLGYLLSHVDLCEKLSKEHHQRHIQRYIGNRDQLGPLRSRYVRRAADIAFAKLKDGTKRKDAIVKGINLTNEGLMNDTEDKYSETYKKLCLQYGNKFDSEKAYDLLSPKEKKVSAIVNRLVKIEKTKEHTLKKDKNKKQAKN